MYLYKMDESSQIFIDKIYELGDYKKIKDCYVSMLTWINFNSKL